MTSSIALKYQSVSDPPVRTSSSPASFSTFIFAFIETTGERVIKWRPHNRQDARCKTECRPELSTDTHASAAFVAEEPEVGAIHIIPSSYMLLITT